MLIFVYVTNRPATSLGIPDDSFSSLPKQSRTGPWSLGAPAATFSSGTPDAPFVSKGSGSPLSLLLKAWKVNCDTIRHGRVMSLVASLQSLESMHIEPKISAPVLIAALLSITLTGAPLRVG